MQNNQDIIVVNKLVSGYGNKPVIDHISFTVKKGELTALLGPNGSGKSTLIKTLLGLLPAESGEVKILGKDPKKVLDQIGYLPQKFEIDRSSPITVEEFLSLSLTGKHSKMAIDEKLSEVDMDDFKARSLSELSGGQLQRVLIARALLNNPQILILDEPEAGIDIGAEKNFYSLIKHLDEKHGITILIVSHEVDLVYDFADQVICLNKTLVCKGVPRQVLTEAKLHELYGGGLIHHDH